MLMPITNSGIIDVLFIIILCEFQQSTKYLAQQQKRLMQQQQQQEFSPVSNATVNSSSNPSLQINLSAVAPPNVSLQVRN